MNAVSVFTNSGCVRPLAHTSVEAILEKIQNPSEKIKNLVTEYRETLNQEVKLSTPSVTWNGKFHVRCTKGLITPSNMMYVDFDEELKSINHLPFIYAAWRSISGNGIGALIKLVGVTPTNFTFNYKKISERLSQNNFKSDHTCDITRLNFISWDENLYVNDNSEIIQAIEPPSVTERINMDLFTLTSNKINFCYKLVVKNIGQFQQGNRNNFTFWFIVYCLKSGINKTEITTFLYQNNLVYEGTEELIKRIK